MRVFSLLCLLAVAPIAAGAAQQKPAQEKPKTTVPAAKSTSAGKGGRTIEITGGDNMKFDVTTINAKPGERLRVVLKSTGTAPKAAMAHNFVLLKRDASPIEFNTAAMNARASDFIPPEHKDKIIANTGLAGPGETVEVSFVAPKEPGTYPYLCSFPGHYAVGMKGDFIVK